MKYLLDTNILSEMRKAKPHGGVLPWFVANEASGFAVPAVAVFELQMGVENLRESDPVLAAEFDVWVGMIVGGEAILPLDAAAAREAARLLNKLPKALMADAMIAAIAREHDLSVATRNTKDFEQFGVRLTNPFLYR